MENTQGLNRRLREGTESAQRPKERGCQGPARRKGRGAPGNLEFFLRVCWKQPPLNDMTDTGSIVRINSIQGSKLTENFLPIQIETQFQAYNYFSAIQVGKGPGAY